MPLATSSRRCSLQRVETANHLIPARFETPGPPGNCLTSAERRSSILDSPRVTKPAISSDHWRNINSLTRNRSSCRERAMKPVTLSRTLHPQILHRTNQPQKVLALLQQPPHKLEPHNSERRCTGRQCQQMKIPERRDPKARKESQTPDLPRVRARPQEQREKKRRVHQQPLSRADCPVVSGTHSLAS